MELLARTLRTFRTYFGTNGWTTALTLGVLAALETIGRQQTSSDWYDVLAASAMGGLVLWLARCHAREPLLWLKPITGAFRVAGTWLKQWLFEIGYDLRGNPPVRRGLPPMIFGLAALFLAWGAMLLAFGDWFPHVLRFAGVNIFYLGYLAVMTLIWGGLLVGICFSFWFSVGLIHDELTAGSDGRGPHGPSRASLFLAMGALLMLASRFLPLWQVLSLCLVAWGALLAISFIGRPGGEACFLWRPRGSVRVRSVSTAGCAAMMFGLGTLVALDLVVTSAGSQVWHGPQLDRASMPLTLTLGSALAWVLLALLWTFVWQAAKERLRSPARFVRRVLHVRGATPEQRVDLLRLFPARQWRVEFDPTRPDSCAAQIELVDQEKSQAREFDPNWPLRVSLADLANAEVRGRIERRGDIQVRRRLVSGLERLFKLAGRRKYRSGQGFWVAPHVALWNGLRRDEPEPEPGPFDTHMVHDNIGPAYHRVFPRLVRHQAYQMMRSLQLDLIFVEDGVTFRRFARVLRRLFEAYDRGRGRPAEDAQFVGLPGTRVMIYEFQFDNPFESDVYPEPKFSTLGRARILLVFRDRTEQEELVEPPFDSSRTPAPLRG